MSETKETNQNAYFEFAEQRPKGTMWEALDKLSHYLRDAYEHDCRHDISKAQELVAKVRILFTEQLDSDIAVKALLASEAIVARDKVKSLEKLWESMNFDFVDKNERWVQIGKAIRGIA